MGQLELVPNHDRERLVATFFPPAQPFDGVVVTRIAREMVAAEALYRDDLALEGT